MSPTREELSLAQQFEQRAFGSGSEIPFSFLVAGKSSAQRLPDWVYSQDRHPLDEHRTANLSSWIDAGTGLAVRCVAVVYDDFPVVEWTTYVRNDGSADSPLISDLRGLDWAFPLAGPCMLHYNQGSAMTPTDFRPETATVESSAAVHLAAADGLASGNLLPYFNAVAEGGGMIAAVGWPGQWAVDFSRPTPTELVVRAGQEATAFRLHPSEEVRAPLIALLFYRGDWARGQNLWRRWMWAHNVPQDHGKPLEPTAFACSSHQTWEMQEASTENQKLFIRRYLEAGLPLDFWWMDAGWYVNGAQKWTNTGTWEVDRQRFPNGLGDVSDFAHARGVKTLLWFEPERVTEGSWLLTNHPEWILTNNLFNLGDPDARLWMTDRVDALLRENRIDLYRQDFNMTPLASWRAADGEERQGITENHHVTGYLAYWDELKRRHPDLLLDSCSGGGRRLDLETMRRAVPRTRSDYQFEPVGQQNMTYGLAQWLPYFGNGLMDSAAYRVMTGVPWFADQLSKAESGDSMPDDDAYLFRSMFFPALVCCFDVRRDDLPYPEMRRYLGEWRANAALMLADFYPLTPYSPENDGWMAWQFDDPESGHGLVQVFRRSGSDQADSVFSLRGLLPDARYTVRNVDADGEQILTGATLGAWGLRVTLPARPGAALLTYRRV